MAALAIDAALEIGKTLVGRIWPDPQKQAEQMRLLEELHQKGDLAQLQAQVDLMKGQLEVNKEEAKSGSLFVAGWRPAVGWAGAMSLALASIPKALVLTAMWTYQSILIMGTMPDHLTPGVAFPPLPPFPDLGTGDVITILGSMLGIGAMRSYDKRNKTQTDKISS